jgi:hypothetical protein
MTKQIQTVDEFESIFRIKSGQYKGQVRWNDDELRKDVLKWHKEQMAKSNEWWNQKLSQAQQEAYEAGRRDEREKINKYGRKYNKNPQRMLKSRHRYHKRIGKRFNNCELCRKEK